MPKPAPGIRIALAIVIGAILAVTLFPAMGEPTRPLRWCAGCGDRGVAHAILNIILFMPLGALLTLAGVPRSWTWLAGGVMSALIEGAQLFIPGRDASIDDVLTNTTGTIVGSLIAVAVLGWLRRPPPLVTPPRRPLGATLASAAVVLAVAATGLLLEPAFPLGGVPLRVRAVAEPLATRPVPLFSHVASTAEDVVPVGLDRADFVLRYRTRGYAWGFDQPDLRLRGAALALTPGDTVDLAMWREPGGSGSRLCLRLGGRHACGLGFTPGRGWGILIYPESFPEWLRRLLDLSWMGGLLFMVGFLSRGDRVGLLVGGAVSLLGLAAVPPWVGLLTTPPLEWLAAVAGLSAGAAAYAALARRARATVTGRPT